MQTKVDGGTMLTVLCLEDSPQDVEIMRELLVDAGYDLSMDCTAVEKEFASLLRSHTYDIILADFKLPSFDGFTALRRAMEICPNVPFICVSGTIGEETAVELLKQGAVDYVIKDRLARLPAAIKRALDEAKEKKSRRQAEEALRESELKLRTVADFTNDWEYWEKENQDIAYISPSCERITGYSPQEFMADPALLKKIVHPEDVDHVKQYYERVFTSEHKNDVDELEFRIIHKNGSVVHIYHVCRPIFDVSDQYHGRRISNRDITERKRAEEELKKSEGKFRAIFDNTSDGMFLVDLNARKFFLCNAMCVKMLGYTQEEFSTLDIADIHPSEDLPFINEQIGKFSRGEEGIRSDIRFKRKDGSIFAADLRPTLLTIAEKKYLLINFNDVTERKHAEEELRETRDYLENLLSFANAPIMVWDNNHRITRFNLAFERLAGYTMYDVIGKHPEMLFFADNRETVLSLLARTSAGEHLVSVEVPIRCKSGDVCVVLWNTANIYAADEKTIIATIAHGQDITKRKRAEEALQESELRFRSLFENATIGIYRTTPDGNILLANPALVKMLGYTSFHKLTERNLEKDGFESSSQRKEFLEKIERDGEVHGYDSKWIRQDGTAIFVLESARAIRDSQGKTLYYDGTVEDITERRQMEEGLRQMQKLEGLGTLAGGIAHDFNNILGIILAYITSAKRFKDDAKKLDLAV
ncbi:MAG: PAS domain S-box protein, partial [Bacteroidota bacterium]